MIQNSCVLKYMARPLHTKHLCSSRQGLHELLAPLLLALHVDHRDYDQARQ